jgi:3-oxoadipate enol-lactonase
VVKVHAPTKGDPSNPAIIFVHALGTDHRFWNEVIDEMKDDYYCIAPDLQAAGGGTPNPPEPVTAEGHARDLADLAQSLGVERAAFVGCAIGGMVAATCVARNPDLATALIMSNPGVRNADDVKIMLRNRVDEVRRHGMQVLLPAAPEKSFHGMPQDGRYRLYVDRYTAQDPEAYALSVLGFLDIDIRPIMPMVKCPLLIIPGGQDILMPADSADVISSLAPHAEVVRFDDVAHFIPFQAPSRFVSTIRPFLRERAGW